MQELKICVTRKINSNAFKSTFAAGISTIFLTTGFSPVGKLIKKTFEMTTLK